MAMTKADYEVTAAAINDVLWERNADLPTITLLTMRFVAAYRGRNPKFDSARFIEQAWASRDTVSHSTGGTA